MSNNLYLRNNYISKYKGKKLFKNWDQYKNKWVAELEEKKKEIQIFLLYQGIISSMNHSFSFTNSNDLKVSL